MPEQVKESNRRDFLKAAALSVPAAAVAATVAPQEAVADEVTGETRMQDTAHTRAYYDSARF
ncbi:twin-arginine translocation signal domain-containing protein [Pseudoruegeria sp. M32A2M]|nr:ubiquinol-cytochrome c reductase iron-sulfur subunit N-terminal domain-containing protein [Aliiruegeria sabulilitoris]NDR56786.1 twin-arginine translocation signal domain-containing protein [Pseudoruegeria sp. M32A2M]